MKQFNSIGKAFKVKDGKFEKVLNSCWFNMSIKAAVLIHKECQYF